MRIENNHYPETPRYLYLMMNLLEKVMIIKSDDYQLTIKNPYNHEGNGESDDDYLQAMVRIPSDYEDTVKSDDDKKSDDHPLTIKIPSDYEDNAESDDDV